MLAERTEVSGPRCYFEGGEGDSWNSEVGAASAAIDDGTGSQHCNSGGLQGFNYVARAAAGGHDVFNHDGRFAGVHSETAAQNHLAGGGISFREEESRAESAGDFVTDDEAADGG